MAAAKAGEGAGRIETMIRDAKLEDVVRITEIYNHYVANTTITFEEKPVSVGSMEERLAGAGAELPWLVSDVGGVSGFAFASPWKSRCAYRYSVESSIYLDPAFLGRGLGRPLYEALIDRVHGAGYRSVIGGIALPNDASVALHERCGFRKVGHFVQVGFKFRRWIDVGYWQRVFE